MEKAPPGFVAPMLALLAEKLPVGSEWLYEVKVDGIRAVAVKQGRDVQLYSRKPREITSEFPQIARAVAALKVPKLVLDGEIVALDEHGRSSFQLLQNLRRDAAGTPLFYVVFDMLNRGGVDLTARPLTVRRNFLEQILPRNRAALRLSPVLAGEPEHIWAESQRLELEGIIAKRKESRYESARRSGAWLKVKANKAQEFVIGGYTRERGSRQFFGAVLVGYYRNRELLFASAVGTGFNTAALRSLHRLFQEHRAPKCPFANLPVQRKGRSGGGLTAAEMRDCTWLKPELVCQVKFYEWTRDGYLRHPVFLGLREDKSPARVVRETP